MTFLIAAWMYIIRRPFMILAALLAIVSIVLYIWTVHLRDEVDAAQANMRAAQAQAAVRDTLLKEQNAAIAQLKAQAAAAERSVETAQANAQSVKHTFTRVITRIKVEKVPVQCPAAVQWGTQQAQSLIKEYEK